MKLFHLSDLHIGKRVNEFSMIEDQKYILTQILYAADQEKPDGILISGDVYDRTIPTAEAVQVFDAFLTRLSEQKIPVFIISGNHDSAERLAFGSSLMGNRRKDSDAGCTWNGLDLPSSIFTAVDDTSCSSGACGGGAVCGGRCADCAGADQDR